MWSRVYGVLLLLTVCLLTACSPAEVFTNFILFVQKALTQQIQNKSVPALKDDRPRDKNGRIASIGNLGGKAIAIPGSVYIVGWVHYQGDPNDFDFSKEAKAYRKEKYKKISYDLPIKGFGFDMRVTDGAVRQYDDPTYQQWYEDNRKYVPKGEPFPWTMVKVDAIPQGVTDQQNKNFYLASSLEDPKDNYQLQKQRINGLLWYQANGGIDPDTGRPWDRFYGRDVLVNRNSKGDTVTVIKCETPTVHVPDCYQYFVIPELQVWINFRYNRHYLPEWQRLERRIKEILNSWIVESQQASATQ